MVMAMMMTITITITTRLLLLMIMIITMTMMMVLMTKKHQIEIIVKELFIRQPQIHHVQFVLMNLKMVKKLDCCHYVVTRIIPNVFIHG